MYNFSKGYYTVTGKMCSSSVLHLKYTYSELHLAANLVRIYQLYPTYISSSKLISLLTDYNIVLS